MHVDRNPDVELSRRLRLGRVPPAGATLDIEAGTAERDALARRFGIIALPELTASVTLRADGDGQWRVEGRLRALVVQACGISLDPVEQAIDEGFVLRFTTQPEEIDRDSGELIVGSEAAEPLHDNALDLGEIVADQLALAIDPFPRKPGVELADILPSAPPIEAGEGPFAALAALKRGRKDQA
jgi:uncharacterized metal-binding protein YceD (DUF177 family)